MPNFNPATFDFNSLSDSREIHQQVNCRKITITGFNLHSRIRCWWLFCILAFFSKISLWIFVIFNYIFLIIYIFKVTVEVPESLSELALEEPTHPEIISALKMFGYTSFRAGQYKAIARILKGLQFKQGNNAELLCFFCIEINVRSLHSLSCHLRQLVLFLIQICNVNLMMIVTFHTNATVEFYRLLMQ